MIKDSYMLRRSDPNSTLEFLCDLYSALKAVDPKDELLKYVLELTPKKFCIVDEHFSEFEKRFSNNAKNLGLSYDNYSFFMKVHYGLAMNARIKELLDIRDTFHDIGIDFD